MAQEIALTVIWWLAFVYYAVEVYFRLVKNRPINFLVREEFWYTGRKNRIFTKILYPLLCAMFLWMAIWSTSSILET